MKMISRRQRRCFCAFCKAPRKIYKKKHVNLTNVVAGIMLAMALSAAYYGQPDPRGLVVFCTFMVISEIFVYLRWRTSLVCRLCGFDPITYKRSPEAAARLVREFFNSKSEDPSFHMSRSPLLKLQKQRKVRERRDNELKFIKAKMLAKRPKPSSQLTPSKSP
jgi:hypothetical protein